MESTVGRPLHPGQIVRTTDLYVYADEHIFSTQMSDGHTAGRIGSVFVGRPEARPHLEQAET
jgi:hypothetical protein